MITAELLETIFNKLPKRKFSFDPIKKLSKNDFLQQLKEKLLSLDVEEEEINDSIEEVLSSNDSECMTLTYAAPDMKEVVFDNENCCLTRLIEHNGYNFLLCESGGDWEFPVGYIIYPTEDGIASYVPENGNSYNKASNTAFGSEGERIPLDDFEEDEYAKILSELDKNDQEYFENDVSYLLEVVGYFKMTSEIIVPGDTDINAIHRCDNEKLVEEFVNKVIE